jgi:hypothetical protein
MRFEYGVYLLNKNIAQLRWHCDTPTSDLRSTLSNLGSLLESLTTREPEEPLPPVRLVLPVAPAVLKGVAPVLSRGTPTRSQPVALQQGAAGSAPRESLQSDSESVSSAKDSDSGDAAPAIALDESQGVQPPPANEEASSAALDSAAIRTVNTTESDHSSNPDDAHQDLVSSPAFNGLVSSLYDISDNGCGVEEEPAIVDGSIIENSGTSPPPSSEEALPPPANGRTEAEEGRSGGEDPELGVAADLFWDSVTSRAQVLSVPTSFKISRQKPYSQF